MPFDPRAAKLLEAGQHITFPEHRGLRLQASQQFKTWIYRYKSPVDGKMKQVKLGRWPAMSIHAAVVAWEAARAAREAGQDLSEERRAEREQQRAAEDEARKRARRQTYTVENVCEDYCKHLDRVRQPKGVKEVRRLFEKMIPDEFKALPPTSVTRAAAFDMLEAHAGTPVVCGSLRAELAAAWDYALDAGRLPETAPNWWRLVMRGKLKSKGKRINGVHVGTEKRHLTLDEIRLLLPFLPNLSRNVADVLTMYLWTGCRGAEIVQMEAEEISEEAGVTWWTCPKAKTKNARHENATDLRVPLFGRAREIVLRRKSLYRTGYLFRAQGEIGGHLSQKVVQTATYWHMPYSMTQPERERPRFPVTRWAPHDLRRTVRTQLAAMGCPDAVAEAVLGHMQPGIKGVYNRHNYDAERVEWLGKWNDVLTRLS